MEEISVGRIVHYVAYGTPNGEYVAGAHRAAIVTAIGNADEVTLAVFNPTGIHWTNAKYSQTSESGTWHWPERA